MHIITDWLQILCYPNHLQIFLTCKKKTSSFFLVIFSLFFFYIQLSFLHKDRCLKFQPMVTFCLVGIHMYTWWAILCNQRSDQGWFGVIMVELMFKHSLRALFQTRPVQTSAIQYSSYLINDPRWTAFKVLCKPPLKKICTVLHVVSSNFTPQFFMLV